MTSNTIIQSLFSITWLTALRQATEHWLRRYWYFLPQFLGESKSISSFLAHINLAYLGQSLVLYYYYKKAITDHTGLSGFVRVVDVGHKGYANSKLYYFT